MVSLFRFHFHFAGNRTQFGPTCSAMKRKIHSICFVSSLCFRITETKWNETKRYRLKKLAKKDCLRFEKEHLKKKKYIDNNLQTSHQKSHFFPFRKTENEKHSILRSISHWFVSDCDWKSNVWLFVSESRIKVRSRIIQTGCLAFPFNTNVTRISIDGAQKKEIIEIKRRREHNTRHRWECVYKRSKPDFVSGK